MQARSFQPAIPAQFSTGVDNVWDWKPRYEPEFLVTDGTSWEIDIGCDRGMVRSSGSNAYPPESAEEVTREFRAFCLAVSSLVGGSPFH